MRIGALALVLFASGCGNSHYSGSCNICPSFRTVNLAACPTEGATEQCATAAIQNVTDTTCGTPAVAHTECNYTNCATAFDCTKVAQP